MLVHLTLDDERIETTPEHPFFVAGRGWVAAGDLRVGDQVQQRDGTTGTVTAVQVETRTQVMYNLTVATAHTFFVGDGGWLVHNTCGPVITSLKKGLPNRNGAGKTAGYLFDQDGNLIGDLIESGRNQYSNDTTLVRGTNRAHSIQDHVEAQAAGIMRDKSITDATLVINNLPCSKGTYTCQNVLPNMIPKGSRLRVIVPDGYDSRGAYDQLFTGVP